MALLRLTQTNTGVDSYRVEVALERKGSSRVTATSEFKFALTAQEREDMRWYFEDYLQYPIEPAPKIAGRIENRLEEIGKELFRSIFHSSEDTRDLWATVRSDIDRYRVEVVTGVQEAASIPWELIRDPKTDTSLALRAEAFVRSHPTPAQQPQFAETGAGPIRVLLVICRPGGGEDVPFRSVASRLVKGLKLDSRESCELKVLRPPTFDQLSRELLRAKLDGKPYHIVHFDGHGVFADTKESSMLDMFAGMSKLMLAHGRGGKHGFLLFESVGIAAKGELVDGSRLGKLLAETHVPLLVLNACRSAHADPPAQPMEAASGAAGTGAHEQVRAFGSLAQEVMDAGVGGVVAMRYNVYVITAAQFVKDLYSSLVQGDSVGIAATAARKQLAAQPMREIGFAPCSLQDWGVPVVYESAAMTLFPKLAGQGLTISLNPGQFEAVGQAADQSLPPRPDIGFFGRDETLLALDRAFDTQAIVLLHSYAGSGKTSTAVEFARWYDLTGGIEGPILFTSFEQYRPLARVLDQLGERLRPFLESVNIHWLALNDRERRGVALQLLQQRPVLWIWDNVEPIAGFPTGTQSAWSAAEQKELVDFLRAASQGQAKFLLTSRRDEQGWLGELPRRIVMPAMPTQERVQLARELVERHGGRLDDVEDWRPLLDFSRGNPFTITVLVGEALRNGLKTKKQIEDFVQRLREGTADMQDDETEGRDRSLGASLSYGFAHAFSDEERRLFALLYLFQGMVSPGSLVILCSDEDATPAPEVHPVTRPAAIAMLEQAAEVGLLTTTIPGKHYTIHPAVPWYFKKLFESYYTDRDAVDRRFVDTMASVGRYMVNTYSRGDRGVLYDLSVNEQNLLHALHLARGHHWWSAVISLLRTIKALYSESGRDVEYGRVLTGAAQDFVDPATDDALPSMEPWWFDITMLRASEVRSSKGGAKKAKQMYTRLIEYARGEAREALANPSAELGPEDKFALSALEAVLQNYGIAQWLDGDATCVKTLEEALSISERLGDPEDEREGTLMQLANAYMDFPSIRDLAKAEFFYRKILDLATKRGDPVTMGHAMHEVGQVLYRRFIDEMRLQTPRLDQANVLVNDAMKYAHESLHILPPRHPLGSHVHHLLGNLYDDVGQPAVALKHYMKSIQIADVCNDLGGSSKGRREVARAYLKMGQLDNALAYALAAKECLETGTGSSVAAGDLAAAQGLLETIQYEIHARGSGTAAPPAGTQ